MEHKETRDKAEKRLLVLLALLYGEAEDLRSRSIPISIDGARAWIADRSQPIIESAFDQIARDVAEDTTMQERAVELSKRTVLPLLIATLADDVVRSLTSGRPLRKTTARAQVITAVTRVISISELAAMSIKLNPWAAQFAADTGGPVASPLFIDPLSKAIWNTSGLANVCPICKPFNKKPSRVWRHKFPFGSPAHWSCNCFMTYED